MRWPAPDRGTKLCGPLEPPPRADKTAHVERAAGESGKVIEEREQDVKGSHEPFILDVLL